MSDPPEHANDPEGARHESERERRDSEIPEADREHRRRRRLEGVIPELIKRAVELGFEKATEAPESFKQRMSDIKLPKEAVAYILSQVDETKNGIFRVFAKEVRDFLEHTNLAGEMQKMLTTVQFEINTTIRFTPNDAPAREDGEGDGTDEAEHASGVGRPEVKVDVFAKRADGKQKKKLGKED
jgi:hypothetical protein